MATAAQKIRASNFNNSGVSGVATSSGSDTTTSASYVDMAGTGATTSFSFTIGPSVSTIKVTMYVGWSATVATTLADFAVKIAGTDYRLGHNLLASGTSGFYSGAVFITGITPSTYTVQGRWRRESASGQCNRTGTNEWLTITCEAIS